ncbi:MAG: PLP-dependent aspartate aminotransferase family protein [Oscillospiraceae bacterium]|jgi:cystathionine gamma-synthase|nr:PLP-dependent aspartate aminotransferase family protein [Oscillospiraceae bacterium]
MKPETACVHAVRDATQTTGAVAVPIYQTATFAHPAVGKSTGYDYSRSGNPTREHAENLLRALEGGAGALAFSSGMSAVNALTELFSPGDEIIATDDLYGGTVRLFDNISVKNGLTVKYADTSDAAAVKSALSDKTRAVFVETPTNPMMKVTDLAAMRKMAPNALLIADNTFLTPYFCAPISLGADIVVHSGTKYLSGHNDTLCGFLVAADGETYERLRFIQKTTGAVLSPFDAFLVTRGIKTLAVRMEKAQENALKIAGRLKNHPKVTAVYYVGLPEHPAYELSKRQTSGFGSMISFSVDSEETAKSVLNKVELILFAESLGGVETLITYPVTQTHADIPLERRLSRGIDERLLRLSVGIEAAEDIIADLERALE